MVTGTCMHARTCGEPETRDLLRLAASSASSVVADDGDEFLRAL